MMGSEDLIATPIDLDASKRMSTNELVSIADEIGGVKLQRDQKLDAPARRCRS